MISPLAFVHPEAKIGENVEIAPFVFIDRDVEIGDGCVIGAGSVVTRDIPPHTLAVGNPCRPVRGLDDE